MPRYYFKKAYPKGEQEQSKDFYKLKKDPDDEGVNSLRYFIEIVKSSDNGTIPNLEEKFKDAGDKVKCIVFDISKDINTRVLLKKNIEIEGFSHQQ